MGGQAACPAGPLRMALLLVVLLTAAPGSWARPTDIATEDILGHLVQQPQRVTEEHAVTDAGRALLSSHGTYPLTADITQVLLQTIDIPFNSKANVTDLLGNSTGLGRNFVRRASNFSVDDLGSFNAALYSKSELAFTVTFNFLLTPTTPAKEFFYEYIKCFMAGTSDSSDLGLVIVEPYNSSLLLFSAAFYPSNVDLQAMMPNEAENIASGFFGGGSCNLTSAWYQDALSEAGATWSYEEFQTAVEDLESFETYELNDTSTSTPTPDCNQTHNIFLLPAVNGNLTRVEGIDTCASMDTHSGSDFSLDGPDYTFYIEPVPYPRIMSVHTTPANGTSYDTYLWAFERCDVFHDVGTAVDKHDDALDIAVNDLLSMIHFELEPNQGMFVVLGGHEDACGLTDVVFIASLPQETNCSNAHSIYLPNAPDGNMTVETVDTCASRDSHEGSDPNLRGKDYTFYLEPTSSPRQITVYTLPSSYAVTYDTYLWAFRMCSVFHDVGTEAASDDDAGEGLLSRIEFSLGSNEWMYVVLGGYEEECGLIDVVFTTGQPPPPSPPPPPASDCNNTYDIFLPATTDGSTTRVEAVDVCAGGNSHDGSSFSLNGPDFTFYIEPTDGTRIMTVETRPTASDARFDTYLWAFDTCSVFHDFGTALASDDDGGDGLLSKLQFVLQPNQGMYIVLSGFARECGLTDVVFTAMVTPPPMPPSPSPPPASPPVPPSCTADRSQSPTGGFLRTCTVHNDPHINQFERDYPNFGYLTCDLNGTFTILENDYITITGFGLSGLVSDWRGASVVENITITWKDPTCGADTVLGYGEDDFEEWDAPFINTRVTTRRSRMFRANQQYLRVFVRTPWTGVGVCANDCPAGTQVDNRRRSLLQDVSESEAKERCEEQGLEEGPFLDTCVFDIVGTQDEKAFLETNKQAEVEESQAVQEAEQDNQAFEASQSPPPPPTSEGTPPDDESPTEETPAPAAPPASERSGAVTILMQSRVSGYDEQNLRNNPEEREQLFNALGTAAADNLAELRPELMLVNATDDDGESAQTLDPTVKSQHREPCYECVQNELGDSGVGGVVAISTNVLLPDDTAEEVLNAFVDEIEQEGADIFEGSGQNVTLQSVTGEMDSGEL